MRDTEYNRYRDSLSDWNYQQELEREREETEYNRRINEENTTYSRQKQAYANLVALIKASGYTPTDAELAAAGLSREAATSLQNEYTRSITPTATATGSSGGSSSGSRSSGGGGSGYSSQTAAIQQQLNAMGAGLDVDGIWGPLTQAAYEKYMGGGTGGNTGSTGSGDRTVNVNGKQTTVNSYGEVRTGNNPTRGEVDRAARQAYQNGEITYQEYRTILSGIH